MKAKLLLLKSANSQSLHERIWWTYKFNSWEEIPNSTTKKLSKSLDSSLDQVYEKYEELTEEQLHLMMKCQVEELQKIYEPLLDDEIGLYDYGGLNDFFIDIVECFPFYVKEKYRSDKGPILQLF